MKFCFYTLLLCIVRLSHPFHVLLFSPSQPAPPTTSLATAPLPPSLTAWCGPRAGGSGDVDVCVSAFMLEKLAVFSAWFPELMPGVCLPVCGGGGGGWTPSGSHSLTHSNRVPHTNSPYCFVFLTCGNITISL